MMFEIFGEECQLSTTCLTNKHRAKGETTRKPSIQPLNPIVGATLQFNNSEIVSVGRMEWVECWQGGWEFETLEGC